MQTLVILEEMQCNAGLGQQREWMPPNLRHSPTSVAYGLRPTPPSPLTISCGPDNNTGKSCFVRCTLCSCCSAVPQLCDIYMASLMFSGCLTHAVTLRFLPACVLGTAQQVGGGSRSWLRFTRGFRLYFLGNDALFATLAPM